MARPKKPQAPLLAIINMERLPSDVLAYLEEMVGRGQPIEALQSHIKKNGFQVNKPTIKKWVANLPIKTVGSVHDFPDDLKERVASWWLTRRDYTACIRDLANAGYKADRYTLQKWYRELLRDEASAEIAGKFDPEKTSISKELEGWALTGTLDAAVDAIMRMQSPPRIMSTEDFSRVTDVLLKVIRTNVSRRKLELEEDHALKRARAEFDTKIRQLLASQPDLARRLEEIAEEAMAELVAQ